MNISSTIDRLNEWLRDGLKALGRILGREAIVIGKDWIQDRWNRVFASKNILILGPKATGKTSLILYLLNGRPFEFENGEKRTPNPTATAAIIDEKFQLQHSNWQKLDKDVPGDPDLRETWSTAIEEVDPRGIIYMLDGREDSETLTEQTKAIRTNVLSNYEQSLRNLTAFHVFLNFADHWADSPKTVRSKKNLVRSVLEDDVLADSFHQQLRTEVSATQLSPERHAWGGTKRALYKFGADLVN